jgi:hypothetical protein
MLTGAAPKLAVVYIGGDVISHTRGFGTPAPPHDNLDTLFLRKDRVQIFDIVNLYLFCHLRQQERI